MGNPNVKPLWSVQRKAVLVDLIFTLNGTAGAQTCSPPDNGFAGAVMARSAAGNFIVTFSNSWNVLNCGLLELQPNGGSVQVFPYLGAIHMGNKPTLQILNRSNAGTLTDLASGSKIHLKLLLANRGQSTSN